MSSTTVHVLALAWFFGCGFMLLRFPRQSYRILALGRNPKQKNLRLAKIVGYVGLGFGALLLIEMAFGIISRS